MLALAGREADIVNLQGVSTAGGVMSEDPAGRTAEATAERIERVRAGAAERGVPDPELSVVVAVSATDRPREAADRLARSRGWGLSADQVLAMPSILMGPAHHLAELVHDRRERFGLSYFILSDAALDPALPLLTLVAR
jgi:hypothetical protein